MPNWCNNFAQITSHVPLEWIDSNSHSESMDLPGSEYHAFALEVNHKVLDTGAHEYKLLFQTKWAPPIDFYDHLIKDSSILIYADYTESGSQILWTYDNDGHHEAEWPNTFYSEIIDQEIHLVDPCKTYIDIEKDEYVLFPEYLQEIRNRTCSNPIINKELEEELQACALQLGVNLEDQQWQEFIS